MTLRRLIPAVFMLIGAALWIFADPPPPDWARGIIYTLIGAYLWKTT